MAAGLLVVWGPGYYLTWRQTAWMCAACASLRVFSMLPLPESPYWLVEAGQIDRARIALTFFRLTECQDIVIILVK